MLLQFSVHRLYCQIPAFYAITIVALFCLPGCGQKPEVPYIEIKCVDDIRQKDVDCQCLLNGIDQGKAEVRTRGNSSLQYPKKSMRLELDLPSQFCGLPTHDVWVLNANYIDKSFIRHRLSFDIFRAMGAHNLAPNGCYHDVFVNNAYHGLYYVTERIDRVRCGISKGQPGGVIFKEPPVFIEQTARIEHPEHPFGQKYPDEDFRDESELAEAMQSFLLHSSDSAFDASVAEWFHLESVADWMLLLLFTNNTDGLLRNFYLYRLHEGLPFRVAIWDYDETYGRYGDNRLNNIESDLEWQRNPLLKRLFERSHFRKLLKERWAFHRDNALRETVISERIDEYVQELEPVIEKNFERWPVDGPGYTDASGFQEEVQLIRNYISHRLKELDGRIDQW